MEGNWPLPRKVGVLSLPAVNVLAVAVLLSEDSVSRRSNARAADDAEALLPMAAASSGTKSVTDLHKQKSIIIVLSKPFYTC